MCAWLVLLAGCGAREARPAPQHRAPSPFSVMLAQGGRPVPVLNHQAALLRAPFDILVETANPAEGILMNVAFEEELYRAALADDPLSDYFQPGTGMAEEAVVKEQSLFIVGSRAHHYLLHDPAGPVNRYHQVTRVGGRYRCRRSVSELMIQHKTVKLEQTREPALFLVFFLGRSVMGRPMERHRDFVAIRFSAR